MQLIPANGIKMTGMQHNEGFRGKLEAGGYFSVFPSCCHFISAALYPQTLPICQTTCAIAAQRALCEHKSHTEKLGISVVNQEAKFLFGRRLLLRSSCRASHCGWHWHADTVMETYTRHTAVCFHFKYPPLPLPQFVLWGHFSRFLPQSPQTSRLLIHLPSLLPTCCLSSLSHLR